MCSNHASQVQGAGSAIKNPEHGIGQGNLCEIDLGPTSTHRNVTLTAAARQRLESGGHSTPTDPPPSSKTIKARPPRLGRDGKPLPPRRNRAVRRNSADLARDALVEQILRESRLDIYDEPETSGAAGTAGVAPGLDEAADERVADAFRREFLASLEEKNSRKSGAPAPPSLGPKLGGSRQQRAAHAMRALEEKAKGKK